MSTMASQITSLTIVYSTVYSGSDQRKHQSSASLAFVWAIHRWLVNSPHKRVSNAENVSISWRHHDHMRYQIRHPMLCIFLSSEFWWPLNIKRPAAQISQRTSPISHDAPFCNRNVHTCMHISATKWCIVRYLSIALWDLWNGLSYQVNEHTRY